MPLFSEFMSSLAERRRLRRTVDGARVTCRLQLQGSAVVTVTTDELDASASARVTSEPWPVPVTSGAYGDFMRVALNFNRNALHHLPCGIVQDPANPSLYRLTWLVPAVERESAQWMHELRLFGTLADKAWTTMPVPGGATRPRQVSEDAQQVIFMP
jgi:hypothetical protein